MKSNNDMNQAVAGERKEGRLSEVLVRRLLLTPRDLQVHEQHPGTEGGKPDIFILLNDWSVLATTYT